MYTGINRKKSDFIAGAGNFHSVTQIRHLFCIAGNFRKSEFSRKSHFPSRRKPWFAFFIFAFCMVFLYLSKHSTVEEDLKKCLTVAPGRLDGWEDDFQVPTQYSTMTMAAIQKKELNGPTRREIVQVASKIMNICKRLGFEKRAWSNPQNQPCRAI